MSGRFSRSLELAKASFAVVRADKELILLPVMSVFALIVIVLSLAVPVAVLGGFTGELQADHGSESGAPPGETVEACSIREAQHVGADAVDRHRFGHKRGTAANGGIIREEHAIAVGKRIQEARAHCGCCGSEDLGMRSHHRKAEEQRFASSVQLVIDAACGRSRHGFAGHWRRSLACSRCSHHAAATREESIHDCR